MDSHPLPDFSAFIATLTRQLRSRRLPFMLIGGQAVLLHGRPRLTEDIDVTLGVDPSQFPVVHEVCRAMNLDPRGERMIGEWRIEIGNWKMNRGLPNRQ